MKTRYIYHYQIAQASPLGEVGEVVVQAPDATMGLNRYSYALGNPLAFTDPSGYEVTGGPISNQPHLQELNHQRSMERYDWIQTLPMSQISYLGFHIVMGGPALSGVITPKMQFQMAIGALSAGLNAVGMSIDNLPDGKAKGGYRYYALQYNPMNFTVFAVGHSLYYNQDEQYIYEVNRKDNGNTYNFLLDIQIGFQGYPGTEPLRWEDPFSSESDFWEFGMEAEGTPNARYKVELYKVWVDDLAAADQFAEKLLKSNWDYFLPSRNCKHFTNRIFRAGQARLSLKQRDPFPKDWGGTPEKVYYNPIMIRAARITYNFLTNQY
ncbi:MAG: hypothetical protein KKA07_15065 [Bacteroidetes bacterium]|nr:hypothetical protein [Bacteroidota bacterium]